MTVNVLIFYQTSGVIASIMYYSNTMHNLHEVSFASLKYYFTFENNLINSVQHSREQLIIIHEKNNL